MSSAERAQRAISAGYDPLGTCDTRKRSLYSKVASEAASGSFPAILKLKCLECCGWDKKAVRDCEIRSCALWVRNRKDLVDTP